MLSAQETRVAESLLADAWGPGVEVLIAEKIWGRSHVLRLSLADGRSVVLKRGRDPDSGEPRPGLPAEVAALSFLNGMETPVAPRLLGATVLAGTHPGDTDKADLLIMEDLGPASSLAHSLLAYDRGRAAADLIAYARSLGAMHAWSSGRGAEFAALAARASRASLDTLGSLGPLAGGGVPEPHWIPAIARGKEPFLRVAAELGLAVDGVAAEIDSLPELMRGPGDAYTGLVHGDACPDNIQITNGAGRLFDFEVSGWGPVALDAAYLLAPFPSCWCFAALPAAVADPALQAYRDQLTRAGVTLGPDWEVALTAALGSWIVARGPAVSQVLEKDEDWGTTTVQPRALTWLRSFADAAARSGALPRLGALAEAMHAGLAARWPGTAVPDYPALARPGAPLAQPPEGWESAS